MPEEAEMLAAFKRGEKVQLPENHPWPPLVKRQCSAGKVMQRARVVSRPPTEYERFELSLYPHSIEAGEQICVYERGSIPEIFRYEVDFWLFDNSLELYFWTALGLVLVGLAAAVLPFVARRGPWELAAFGAVLMAALLLPDPSIAAVPAIAAVWLTCGVCALRRA
jgi:hypothetical protein